MARYLLTASGFRMEDGPKLRAACKGSGVRITGIKMDQVFLNTGLITVSCENKRGATKVQNILWDDIGCGCVEIDKLPETGYGGRRMGEPLPVNSYMD